MTKPEPHTTKYLEIPQRRLTRNDKCIICGNRYGHNIFCPVTRFAEAILVPKLKRNRMPPSQWKWFEKLSVKEKKRLTA